MKGKERKRKINLNDVVFHVIKLGKRGEDGEDTLAELDEVGMLVLENVSQGGFWQGCVKVDGEMGSNADVDRRETEIQRDQNR